MLTKKNILGVALTDVSMDEALEYILASLEKPGKKYQIVTPNPELLVYASKHPEYQNVLNHAELSLCDGVGLLLASKILRKPLRQRITGVDLLQQLCKKSVRKPIKIGFLGGRAGVAERVAKCLVEKYPGLQIGFVGEEWPESGMEYKVLSSKYQEKEKKTLNTKYLIHNTNIIDILFVAFGSPKQEEWIYRNLEKLPVRIAIGVGGAFDIISGRIPRAPRFVRSVGMEWLYRLVREPWRWRRQLALVEFVGLVIKERVKGITY